MGGRASRAKGKRGEYIVRDYFRSLGYEAHRVPSSGAAQGFPGDIEVSKDGDKFLVEVKSRKNSFESIYNLTRQADGTYFSRYFYAGDCVAISNDFSVLNVQNEHYGLLTEPTRTLNKIKNLKKLLKGCKYLVIKDDNKPLLFIKYL